MRVPQARLDVSSLAPVWLWIALAATAGCTKPPQAPEVIVYTSASKPLFEAPLQHFHDTTQINVTVMTAEESTDVSAMKKALLDGSGHPLGDVLWFRDLLPTLLLDQEGLFEPYQPAQWKAFASHSSPQQTWHGFSARARVLLVNKNKVTEDARPKSIRDLVDDKWKGRAGLATPLRATSAAHAAALFAGWETAKAEDFYRRLKENARIVQTEEEVARLVVAGELDFALTDSDVAMARIDGADPVVMVYPDQGPDSLGTLLIPMTAAIFKDCAHPQPARDLVEYFLSPGTEADFSAGPAALAPVSARDFENARLPGLKDLWMMRVDYERMAAGWKKTSDFLHAEFGSSEK